MTLNLIFAALALLSLLLLFWQWLVARRFPLHRRLKDHSFPPAVTLLKPLKGCDEFTENCLRSWFEQDYTGRVQILFGVASSEDPVCAVVRNLIQQHPASDAQLIICAELLGPNAKLSKLVEMERLAKHDLLVISDADVRVPPDLLSNLIPPLRETIAPLDTRPPSPSGEGSDSSPLPSDGRGARGEGCGLATCFYRLANPTTLAMRWEAVAINADFWSQVLQAQSLKPINFALGAVMAIRRAPLREIGGFVTLVNCLADDYQLGNRLARRGYHITICPIVVECWSAPMNWSSVWKHQLRWARTIRVCQPLPYFFSILSNPTLWPLLWLALNPSKLVLAFASCCLLLRILTALDLQKRLIEPGRDAFRHPPSTLHHPPSAIPSLWLIPLKDLFQFPLWLLAFLGNRIEWRGQRLRLRSDGTLEKI